MLIWPETREILGMEKSYTSSTILTNNGLLPQVTLAKRTYGSIKV